MLQSSSSTRLNELTSYRTWLTYTSAFLELSEWLSLPAFISSAGEAKSGIGVVMIITEREVVIVIDVADVALLLRLNCSVN